VIEKVTQTGGRIFRAGIRNHLMTMAGVVVFFAVIAAFLGPELAPSDPLNTDLSHRLSAPSRQFPLGNDALGRCLLSRILVGSGTSLGLGVAVVVISSLLGLMVGLGAGYRGGLLDELLMRITDMFFSFPEIVAAMAVAGIMGPGYLQLLLSLSAASWMRYARVVRAIALSVRERDYVKAARLGGASRIAIICRHILPAVMPSMVVLATVGLAKAVLAVSALGFLGFGVQPPHAEWGMLLMEGKDYIMSAPHLSVFPGFVIMATVLAFNILGDGLREIWVKNR
jgi:peptide/nickel transport system permease protein